MIKKENTDLIFSIWENTTKKHIKVTRRPFILEVFSNYSSKKNSL